MSRAARAVTTRDLLLTLLTETCHTLIGNEIGRSIKIKKDQKINFSAFFTFPFLNLFSTLIFTHPFQTQPRSAPNPNSTKITKNTKAGCSPFRINRGHLSLVEGEDL